MNNVDIFMSHDVTGCLLFGRDIEVFFDYIKEDREGNKVYWKDTDDITLSNGSDEEKSPLPIITALIKNYIAAYKEHPDAFCEKFYEDNEHEEIIIPAILKQTILDLGLNSAHLGEESWINPHRITNEDYLFINGLTEEKDKVIFPLIFEIQHLIRTAVILYKNSGNRLTNMSTEFNDISLEFIDYAKYLAHDLKNPHYIINQRIKELTFKPASVIRNDKDDDEIKYSFAVEPKAGILSLAWAELYFAGIYEMPISICTYCGKVYKLIRNFNKSTCDCIECKKQLRRDRDQRIREESPETEREKDRIRQQKLRDKNKAIQLQSTGKNREEILSIINKNARKRKDPTGIRTLEDIKRWVK
ncbi:hypothetical protein [Metabacillus litoralis]|uniref:hypothetical protein n=1 Tax=Metabacillus litoralis TaxID=152268 RepID=UPI002040CE98|nr:hypothetical protein [Metabacillus litoralis]MCM3165116.1 hypothetical protein [Metabacillus litoralis]